MIRILHIYSGNLYGGIETLLLTLAEKSYLCPEMKLEFALCFDARLSREMSEIQPVHMLGAVRLRYPWTWARARRRLRDVLTAGNFDLVVCHSPWSQAIFGPVVRRMGLPLIFSIHDATDGRFWLERWARRTTPDLVLCNSQFTTTTLLGLYPGTPIAHIYWPVSSAPQLSAAACRNIRAELQTPESDVVIIQVSRLERWKGHLLHLEALSRIADLPDWTCWQVGGPQKEKETEYLTEIEACANRLGIKHRIRFPGQRKDVGALLAAADIHCQPNMEPEPFGRTFIEALAAGLPVVTTRMGAAVEIVDSSCGILVPPADPDSLAEALRTLASNGDLRRRYGAAGRARAEQLCNPPRQLAVLRDIFTSVLSRSLAA
jgi:glycosyltransferase involved in cell wall biosynthesis